MLVIDTGISYEVSSIVRYYYFIALVVNEYDWKYNITSIIIKQW